MKKDKTEEIRNIYNLANQLINENKYLSAKIKMEISRFSTRFEMNDLKIKMLKNSLSEIQDINSINYLNIQDQVFENLQIRINKI